MFSRLVRGRFFSHLLGCNLVLVAAVIIYNLVTYFIPLVKLSLAAEIVFFGLVNVLLITLKVLATHP